jgi:hypothetical protein
MSTSFRFFAAVIIATVASCGVKERCFDQVCQDGAGGEGATGGSAGVTATSSGGGVGGDMSSASGVGGTGGVMTSSVGASGGNGSLCGGKMGLSCKLTEYCDYPDDLCGGADGLGTCRPRPSGCPKIFLPACGCDGVVHGNTCEANGAGVDISNNGGCKAPPDRFSCGAHFCDLKGQYCVSKPPQQNGMPGSYSCAALPAACASLPDNDCMCLASVPCGNKCQLTNDGGRIVICG